MATTLWLSTWIQVLPMGLKRLFGIQQPSSSGSNQASTPNNPTSGAANHDDEWGEWVISTPKGEEQVKKDVPPLVEEDWIHGSKITLEALIARKRIMVGQREEAGDKDQKPSDGEEEDDPFHLEEIHPGIRMPCHTPPDSDDTHDIGPCILDLGTSELRWHIKPGKSQAIGNTAGSFWYFENDNAEV